MKRVRLIEAAIREINEAYSWYDDRSERAAAHFQADVLDLLTVLTRFPRSGAPGGQGTRKLRLRRFPFALVYAIHDDEIRVIALAHDSRRPGYWQDRID